MTYNFFAISDDDWRALEQQARAGLSDHEYKEKAYAGFESYVRHLNENPNSEDNSRLTDEYFDPAILKFALEGENAELEEESTEDTEVTELFRQTELAADSVSSARAPAQWVAESFECVRRSSADANCGDPAVQFGVLVGPNNLTIRHCKQPAGTPWSWIWIHSKQGDFDPRGVTIRLADGTDISGFDQDGLCSVDPEVAGALDQTARLSVLTRCKQPNRTVIRYEDLRYSATTAELLTNLNSIVRTHGCDGADSPLQHPLLTSLVRHEVNRQWLFESNQRAWKHHCLPLLIPGLRFHLRALVLKMAAAEDHRDLLLFFGEVCRRLEVEDQDVHDVFLSLHRTDSGGRGRSSPGIIDDDAVALRTAAVEETAFSTSLESIAQAIAGKAKTFPQLRWASDVLKELASERPDGFSVYTAISKPHLEWMRAGYRLDFEFCLPKVSASQAGVRKVSLSADFLRMIDDEQIRRGEDFTYFRLTEPFLELRLPPIQGRSGALALRLALELGMRNHLLKRCVATSVAFDAQGNSSPVDSLSSKIETFLEHGGRVFICHPTQVEEVRSLAEGRLFVLPFDGDVAKLAQQLIEAGLTVEDRRLEDCRQRKTVEPRRKSKPWLSAAVGVAAAVALGWAVGHTYLKSAPTQAMLFTERRQTDFDKLCAQIRTEGKDRRFGQLMRHLIDSNVTVSHPPEFFETISGELAAKDRPIHSEARTPTELKAYCANLLGIGATEILSREMPVLVPKDLQWEVIADSRAFDLKRWRPLNREEIVTGSTASGGSHPTSLAELIATRPQELSTLVRVVKLRAMQSMEQAVFRVEANSSGYGVVPLIEKDKDEVQVFLKGMSESEADLRLTIATIVTRRLGRVRQGEVIEVPFYSVFVNSFQDTNIRESREEWIGARILPGTKQCDLGIRLPDDVIHPKFRTVMREEEAPADCVLGRLGEPKAVGFGAGQSPATPIRRGWHALALEVPTDWAEWQRLHPDKKAVIYCTKWSWSWDPAKFADSN